MSLDNFSATSRTRMPSVHISPWINKVLTFPSLKVQNEFESFNYCLLILASFLRQFNRSAYRLSVLPCEFPPTVCLASVAPSSDAMWHTCSCLILTLISSNKCLLNAIIQVQWERQVVISKSYLSTFQRASLCDTSCQIVQHICIYCCNTALYVNLELLWNRLWIRLYRRVLSLFK